MSVKQDLERLHEERQLLIKKKMAAEDVRDSLYEQKKALTEKKQALSGKNSPLARTLKEKNQNEANALNEQIEEQRKTVSQLSKALMENRAKIDKREKDTALYIQEQVDRMVSEFLKWAKVHLEEIGSEISKPFYIFGITKPCYNECDGKYYGYTGNIGIFEATREEDGSHGTPITFSIDFYFEQKLYHIGYDRKNPIAITENWYNQYVSDFATAFLKKLSDVYDLSENLRLILYKNSYEFVLELV